MQSKIKLRIFAVICLSFCVFILAYGLVHEVNANYLVKTILELEEKSKVLRGNYQHSLEEFKAQQSLVIRALGTKVTEEQLKEYPTGDDAMEVWEYQSDEGTWQFFPEAYEVKGYNDDAWQDLRTKQDILEDAKAELDTFEKEKNAFMHQYFNKSIMNGKTHWTAKSVWELWQNS